MTEDEILSVIRSLNPVQVAPNAGGTPVAQEQLRRILAAPRASTAEDGTARQRRPSLRSRHVVLAIAVVAAVIPLAAVAASQEWWFFRFGQAPPTISDVRVVKTGTWDGKEWELIAYLSSTDGVCFGIRATATAQTTAGAGGMACDAIAGVPRTAESKEFTPHAITFTASSPHNFPSYIIGPVIDTAEEVEIHLADGRVLRTSTFDAPDDLGAIRFYAVQAQLPEVPNRAGPTAGAPVRKLIAFNADGQAVACLVLPTPADGLSLSACR
jgi:hypothetical protein